MPKTTDYCFYQKLCDDYYITRIIQTFDKDGYPLEYGEFCLALLENVDGSIHMLQRESALYYGYIIMTSSHLRKLYDKYSQIKGQPRLR